MFWYVCCCFRVSVLCLDVCLLLFGSAMLLSCCFLYGCCLPPPNVDVFVLISLLLFVCCFVVVLESRLGFVVCVCVAFSRLDCVLLLCACLCCIVL